MHRAIPIILAGAAVAFVVAALLAGDAIWAVPVLILFGIVSVMAAGQWALKRHVEAVDGDTSLPATHVEADEETQLGDSPELHEELSPHDLPKDHPGRAELERA